jgi:hypothetical protein
MRRFLQAIVGLGALLAMVPASAQVPVPFMAVDGEGNQVALLDRGSAWDRPTVTVHRVSGRHWKPVAKSELARSEGLRFVGRLLLIGTQLHAVGDGSLTPVGAPLASSLTILGVEQLAVHGNRVLVTGTDFPASAAELWEATGQGWSRLGSIAAADDVAPFFATRHLAFDGNRLAVLLLPHGSPCGVLVYDRSADDAGEWVRSALFFPEVCAEPEIAHGHIALHGDRLLIGAHPALKGPGELALHARGAGGWQQLARLQRPDQQGDFVDQEILPFGFGHRVALDDTYLYAGGGYQSILEDTPAATRGTTVHNGVFVISAQGDGWQTRKHVVHAELDATFGQSFEVRGKRLFVDSPLEPAVHVFERRRNGWKHVARIADAPR